jgi:hypothetical protein
MSPRKRGSTRGELALALGLLVVALGVDLFWLRPAQGELDRLAGRRQAAEQNLRSTKERAAQTREVLEYVNEGVPADGDWKAAYRHADPLATLEHLRKSAGLRLLDLSMEKRTPGKPFTRTSYFMGVYGNFDRQIRFLRALEAARPLILVDSFIIDTGIADPYMSLKVNLSVLSLSGDPAP